MANEERTGIFHFEVDQKDALTKMESLKKLIIQNKQEQDALRKAFKAGSITIGEYSKESVRLEAILKKNQNEYGQLQKSVTGVKNSFDKLIDSNQKISKDLQNTSKSFKDAASNINIAGVNVGGLATKLTSFLNPATAAVGIVTALVSAYAASAIGARDLVLATDQLGAGFKIALNSYGDFVSELKKDKDSGFFEDAAFAINQILFGVGTANRAAAVAAANEQIKLLQISSAFAKGFAKDREREAEDLRKIRDDEAKTEKERLEASDKITEKLKNNEQLRVTVLKATAEAIKDASTNYKLDYEAQLKVAQVESEIKDIQEEINGKLTENVTAARNLSKALREGEAAFLAQQKAAGISLPSEVVDLSDPNAIPKTSKEEEERTKGLIEGTVKIQLDSAALLNKELDKYRKDNKEKEKQSAIDRVRIAEAADQARLNSATILTGALAGLADEGSAIQKGLTLTAISLDTAAALTGGIKAAQSIPYPGNLVAMATTIATILGNIAAAKQTLTGGFASGGYTGDGPKYKPAGIVHAGEVVWSQEDVAKAGGAETVNRMRPTYRPAMRNSGQYADGGLVTNASVNAINQQMILANALKGIPAPVVGVVQFAQVQKQVNIKQNTAKIGGQRNAS